MYGYRKLYCFIAKMHGSCNGDRQRIKNSKLHHGVVWLQPTQ